MVRCAPDGSRQPTVPNRRCGILQHPQDSPLPRTTAASLGSPSAAAEPDQTQEACTHSGRLELSACGGVYHCARATAGESAHLFHVMAGRGSTGNVIAALA